MKLTIRLMFFMSLILNSLVACGPEALPTRGNTATTYPIQAPTTGPATVAEPMEPQVQPPMREESTESIKLAKQDLARRLGISVDSVTVVAVIGQEFSKDAFYCRTSKDRIAKEESPLVMSGLSILLSASGRQYEYHASGQIVTFCRPLH